MSENDTAKNDDVLACFQMTNMHNRKDNLKIEKRIFILKQILLTIAENDGKNNRFREYRLKILISQNQHRSQIETNINKY